MGLKIVRLSQGSLTVAVSGRVGPVLPALALGMRSNLSDTMYNEA